MLESRRAKKRLTIVSRQKANEYKGNRSSAPSAGFEPATPGLGNLLCIRASQTPENANEHGVFAFSRFGAFRCSVLKEYCSSRLKSQHRGEPPTERPASG